MTEIDFRGLPTSLTNKYTFLIVWLGLYTIPEGKTKAAIHLSSYGGCVVSIVCYQKIVAIYYKKLEVDLTLERSSQLQVRISI